MKATNPDLAAVLGVTRPEILTALRRATSSSQAVALLLMSPEPQRIAMRCHRGHQPAPFSGCGALTRVPPSEALFAHTGGPSRLVVILRGALDGLAAVPPYGDPAYAGLHRELAIAAPGGTDGALALNNLFGLHPSLAFLHERFAAGELIVFSAACSPYRDRSHFDGQNVLENGLTKPIGTADGWLNRALAALPRGTGRAPDRAVAISQNVPLILRGEAAVISKSPQTTPDVDEDLLARLADLYSRDDWFAARLSEAVLTEKMVDGAADAAMDKAAARPGYPDRAGGVARMAAELMRRDGGRGIACREASGWDTHAQ